jgi:phospholipase/carboxylesterase
MKKIILLLALSSCLVSFFQEKKINTDLVYKVNMPLRKTDKAPVLILLHGYGSNETDLFDIARSFDERLITFSLRGPFPANGGEGYSWFELSKDAKGNRKINYKEAIESRKKILSFISNACAEYKLDSTHVLVAGFSQGAIMSFDLAFAAPQKLKAVLPLSGILLQESRDLKPKDETLAKVSFFIAHGNQDNVIDVKMSQDANTYLIAKKVPVTYEEYQMGHSLNGLELNDMKAFIKKNLKPEKEKEAVKTSEKKSK